MLCNNCSRTMDSWTGILDYQLVSKLFSTTSEEAFEFYKNYSGKNLVIVSCSYCKIWYIDTNYFIKTFYYKATSKGVSLLDLLDSGKILLPSRLVNLARELDFLSTNTKYNIEETTITKLVELGYISLISTDTYKEEVLAEAEKICKGV